MSKHIESHQRFPRRPLSPLRPVLPLHFASYCSFSQSGSCESRHTEPPSPSDYAHRRSPISNTLVVEKGENKTAAGFRCKSGTMLKRHVPPTNHVFGPPSDMGSYSHRPEKFCAAGPGAELVYRRALFFSSYLCILRAGEGRRTA
ncbi:hypothetical protein L249_4077 [Ophiocordyceps polyrhachis-furcata BCC 54312]|uniref:Uncharacterized protein n=1 Tax=Ophiocordyceps polyrhachis-furcata BCC 54312 TaxID=1330021 RepID=A0A367L5R2_9HYPO|nr:hypothetical protein L249_4077 [Ophiocordyceps polyrhachis-furcata BCC 54312]